MRLALALLASIISVAALCGLGLGALVVRSGDYSAIGVSVAIVLAYTFGATIGALVVGLPLHLVLAKRQIRGLLPYLLVGGLVPSAVVLVCRPLGNGTGAQLLAQIVLSGALGAASALVFWLIAVRFAVGRVELPIK